MAKGKKTGGRNFIPGVVTNPAGRPKLPAEIKSAAKFTKTEVEATLGKYLDMSPEQLKTAKNNPGIRMLDLFVISIISHGVNKGDQQRLDFLCNRLIGKVKDDVAVNGQIQVTVEDYTK